MGNEGKALISFFDGGCEYGKATRLLLMEHKDMDVLWKRDEWKPFTDFVYNKLNQSRPTWAMTAIVTFLTSMVGILLTYVLKG